MVLESIHNPRIKNIISLQQKSKTRKKQGVFVVEGIKEMELALESDFELIEVYYCEAIFKEIHLLEKITLKQQFKVSQTLFEKLSYRNTGGIIALFKTKNIELEALKLKKQPLIIVLEGIEKPGNLGAVLRTADAANVDAVIACDPIIDLYNPNVVRSSVGCLFSVPLIKTTSKKAIEWLKENQIAIHVTYLHENTISLYDSDLEQSTAIVMGTEAVGVTSQWVEHADALIKVPMQGKIDSLNVSNATAICVFEAVRQRSLKKN